MICYVGSAVSMKVPGLLLAKYRSSRISPVAFLASHVHSDADSPDMFNDMMSLIVFSGILDENLLSSLNVSLTLADALRDKAFVEALASEIGTEYQHASVSSSGYLRQSMQTPAAVKVEIFGSAQVMQASGAGEEQEPQDSWHFSHILVSLATSLGSHWSEQVLLVVRN